MHTIGCVSKYVGSSYRKIRRNIILRYEWERKISSEVVDSTLSRKASIECIATRTANRHR